MRITRDALMKNASTAVAQRSRSDRSLMAAYLCGSLLGDDFVMGGAADLDLVFVHSSPVEVPREIIPLTGQVHLDIGHHAHRDYRTPRNLRLHPWLGPTIYECAILYDPQHLMDFTQASVRGQFFRPEFVLQRSRTPFEHARQIWTEVNSQRPAPTPQALARYFHILEHAANAVALLNGPPLTERRFLQRFPARADAAHHPGLYQGVLGLLGAQNVEGEEPNAWIASWQAAYDAVSPAETPARFHPARKAYYLSGFESLLKGDEPKAALWPLLRTWTQLASMAPNGSDAVLAWEDAARYLGLTGEGFAEKLDAMDAYLDTIEETLESWARENGVEPEA